MSSVKVYENIFGARIELLDDLIYAENREQKKVSVLLIEGDLINKEPCRIKYGGRRIKEWEETSEYYLGVETENYRFAIEKAEFSLNADGIKTLDIIKQLREKRNLRCRMQSRFHRSAPSGFSAWSYHGIDLGTRLVSELGWCWTDYNNWDGWVMATTDVGYAKGTLICNGKSIRSICLHRIDDYYYDRNGVKELIRRSLEEPHTISLERLQELIAKNVEERHLEDLLIDYYED